jgi:small subunit ribosomal protein S5
MVKENSEIVDKVVKINRCAKVVKGGRRFSFNALVVVGDQRGKVGYALGKAKEVPLAVRKGIEKAKKEMFDVPLIDGTIPYRVIGEYESTKVLLKPAKPGTGNIAGGAIRAVLEVAGVSDIYTKCYGSTNPHNSLKATINGLKKLESPRDMMIKRGVIIPKYEKFLSERDKAIIRGEIDIDKEEEILKEISEKSDEEGSKEQVDEKS